MSFPKYESYVDSGLEWLGSVPSHWAVKRLGHFFEERREKVSDKDFAPLSVTMKGIVPRLETAAKTQDGDNRKKVLEGDFVINSRSDRKGSSGVAPQDGSVSLICIVARPKGIEPYFAHHLLRSVSFQEEFYRYGKGIVADLWSTGYSEMKNIVIPVPPSPEQQKIAAFLDHETAKIDVLIAEQQRLIELLKEKRQAVISHAVTKGLNPNAPMKDSGVEWLGEVPAHWVLGKLGRFCSFTPGYAFSSSGFIGNEDEIKLLRGINVGVASIKWDETVYWPQDKMDGLERFLLKEGQVVIGMDRPWIGQGMRVSRVSKKDMPCLLLQRVGAFEPDKTITSSFIFYSLSANNFRAYLEPDFTGISVPHISGDQILSYVMALPPLEAQKEICELIERTVFGVDNLVGESEKAIALYQERRSALISAAVTGKIDVRDWQPRKSTSPEPILQAAEEAASYG